MDSCKENRMGRAFPLSQGKGKDDITYIFILEMNQKFVLDQ